MLNLKLALFKIKNFLIIIKSRLLKKKISLIYKENKKNFEKLIENKSFSHKWFLNNFEIFSHYLPKELNKEFSYLEIGSFEGLSALNILSNYPNSKVTVIDLWSESNLNSESLEVNFIEVEKRFDENLKGYNFIKIKKDSVIALRELLKKRIFFDLTKYIKYQLLKLGIKKIEIINKDTYKLKNTYFSARRSLSKKNNDYGRNISLIMIN